MLAASAAMGLLVAQPLAPATAHAATLCVELNGADEPEGLCRVHDTEPNYVLDMSFPVDFPDQAAVDDFVAQTRTGFLNATQTPSFGNVPYALDMKVTLWSSDTTRSVSFEIYQDLGGAHPDTWYKTFNYDTVRNRPIEFDDLFAPGAKPLEAIFPIVQRELAAETGMSEPVIETDGMDPSKYRKFAITPTELVFFFDRGELMAGAAGAQTVQVPRSAIPPLAV
ncbi:hypothetical protein MAGR_44480 [Mycolicibacterium agri]|uniref:DUF3298 domain-containing protein n=1 Tax=Mycolicibacterium agri TaxID=36811 RepID=A0A7I9W6K4_MYCAG|nr:hypothetical protein MAGR_44480 [Mycolicibacterium agri]